MTLTKDSVIHWLETEHGEEEIEEKLDEEINNGNWVDDDWEDEHESMYDWYMEYGNGEAEDAVRESLEAEILENFDVDYETYEECVGECIWDTIVAIYECLETN